MGLKKKIVSSIEEKNKELVYKAGDWNTVKWGCLYCGHEGVRGRAVLHTVSSEHTLRESSQNKWWGRAGILITAKLQSSVGWFYS